MGPPQTTMDLPPITMAPVELPHTTMALLRMTMNQVDLTQCILDPLQTTMDLTQTTMGPLQDIMDRLPITMVRADHPHTATAPLPPITLDLTQCTATHIIMDLLQDTMVLPLACMLQAVTIMGTHIVEDRLTIT